MATSLTSQASLAVNIGVLHGHRCLCVSRQHHVQVQALRHGDFDGFAGRVVSGEALKDAWRIINEGVDHLFYDARKTAERFDRHYSFSRRLNSFARSAAVRVRLLDDELGIRRRWRMLTLDFSRNWPRYQRQLRGFLDSPMGRSCTTVFFLWLALSGWWFRLMILATWVLPIAAPLLMGTVANNLVIEGVCPSCKRRFMGYKHGVICCTSCRSIVWQPGNDFFKGNKSNVSAAVPEIIDIEIEGQ